MLDARGLRIPERFASERQQKIPPKIEHRFVGRGFLSVLRCAPAVRNDNGGEVAIVVVIAIAFYAAWDLSFRAGGTAGTAGAVKRGENSPADLRRGWS